MKYDIVIIGAGPGGYVAAIRATQLGLKVALIEKEEVGGICLNWGCIPTKSLLKSAEVLHQINIASSYGIQVDKVAVDINKMIMRSRSVSKQLTQGVNVLLKKNKVELIKGVASLLNPTQVQIVTNDQKQQVIDAKHIILATGARARIIPNLEPDGKLIWSYKEALIADKIPKRLLVVGSGAIGIEFANFFNTIGSEVTVVEALDKILKSEDNEISKLAHKSFEKQGIKILLATKLLKVEKLNNEVKVTLLDIKSNQEKIITVDVVLSAVGVVPNVENLSLDNTKVKVEDGKISTTEFLQTAESNIYAIGDLTQGPWLAHKASHEGIIAVEHIANLTPHRLDYNKVPACIYTSPQIASIGLTEQDAKQQGIDVKIGRFPFIGNGKAIALGEPEGLVKTIFDAKTGELLGAHMIGAEVTELIQGYIIAMNLETTHNELINTIFPHPTLSEMMHESVLNSQGRTIHF